MVTKSKTKTSEKKPAKSAPESTVKTKTEDSVAPKTGKDATAYEFNGKKYGKGRLVLAVVTAYIEQNKGIKFEDLKKAFPKDLHPRFGVVAKIEDAEVISKTYKRYYMKFGEVKALTDKTKVCVCSQWGIGNIQPFIDHAVSIGLKITESKE